MPGYIIFLPNPLLVLIHLSLRDEYIFFIFMSREECACNPVRYFAILSMQRSGSGWFETLLNSHINVSSNGEIFSVKDRRINVSSIIITMDKVYNLDWFSSASKNECSAAVGFKWMLNQVGCFLKWIPYVVECYCYEDINHVPNFAGIDGASQGHSRLLQYKRGFCDFPVAKKFGAQNDLCSCKFL